MSSDDKEQDEASVEAAYWLLALEEQSDDAELRTKFSAWLAARPENARAWAGISDVYDLIGTPAYAAHRSARQAAAGPDSATPAARATRRKRRLPVLASAAALAVAAAFAFLAIPGLLLQIQADHMTAVAETRAFVLDDGSTVHLAPGSAVELLRNGDRGVRLLKGEALFDVKRDPARRFRVIAGDVETTVVGTIFDVRLLEDGAVVAVREGEVRVDLASANPPLSERLRVGDWARVGQRGGVSVGNVPPSEIGSWQGGQIVARNQTIADVVEEIRRSFQGTIILASRSIGEQQVTGVYNLADPVAALRAVAGVYGGTVTQVSPWLLIVSGDWGL